MSAGEFDIETYRVPALIELPMELTGCNRDQAEANNRRLQAITGLRNLARMLVDHPELPTPYSVTVQAGPATGVDWEPGRQFVIDVAEAIGQSLDVNTETAATLRITLHDHRPRVAYTVHHGRKLDTEEGTR